MFFVHQAGAGIDDLEMMQLHSCWSQADVLLGLAWNKQIVNMAVFVALGLTQK